MAPFRFLRLLTFGLGMIAGTACSSPKERGLCPEFSACGGPLDGRWDAVSFCVAGNKAEYANNAEPIAECRQLYLSVLYQNVVSSLDFTNSNSQIGGTVTYRSQSELELTTNCSLAIYGSDVTPEICADFAEKLANQGWDVPVKCEGSDNCYCSSGATAGPSSIIYDRTAGKLMLQTGEQLSYCVNGETMQLKDRSQGIDIVINYARVH